MASLPAHILAAGLLWKSATGGTLPPGAVEGGIRHIDQSRTEPLYVARVLAPDGKYHPAMTAKSIHNAHYYFNGKETASSTYDILVLSAGDMVTLEWVKASDGKIPAYAVQVDRNNELYVGRHLLNEPIMGEVNTAEGKCIVVTVIQSEKEYSEYEVLCAIPHALATH